MNLVNLVTLVNLVSLVNRLKLVNIVYLVNGFELIFSCVEEIFNWVELPHSPSLMSNIFICTFHVGKFDPFSGINPFCSVILTTLPILR